MLRMVSLFAFCCVASALNALTPVGKWVSNIRYFENNNYDRLQLELNGTKLVGKLDGDSFDGTYQNGQIEGVVKTGPHETLKLHGELKNDRIEGTATGVEENLNFKWEAYREAAKNGGPPKTHTFEPTQFEHYFSDAIKPVLRLNPGDTVKTWSVDAGGTDSKGVRRTSGGNPLTGPFYVEGAIPGDTLVVHLNRLRLNRDSQSAAR